MAEFNVYTVLSVPTAISFPSPRCLRWSAGGQLVFITKSAVYILAPDHAINFDSESLAKSTISRDLQGGHLPVSWFRTMVQDEKIMEGTRWPELSQVWGAISLGSIDSSITAVECSPTTVSKDGQVVIALLTSNMDMSLWKAGNNYLKGEWQKVMDVTPILLNHFGARGSADPSNASVLRSQSTCMCWTSQPDFALTPHPLVDGSLLAVGNRGGVISLLRYSPQMSPENNPVLESVSVTDTWVTHLASSSWTLTAEAVCASYLAFGAADGSVGYMKLQETLSKKEATFIPRYQVDLSTEQGDRVLGADKAGITGLEWFKTSAGADVLVVCKPGLVYLWALPNSSGVAWSGTQCLELVRQPVSSAASPYHPASGISYSPSNDSLTISLLDGSIHVVQDVTQNPQWSSSASSKLSQNSRNIFAKVEPGPIDHKVMNRVSGFTNYDSSSTFVWAHESAVPSDFSYKHDAKHNSTIVVARLAETVSDDRWIRLLEESLSVASGAHHSVSLRVLRPFFFGLYNQRRLESMHEMTLALLKQNLPDFSVNIVVSKLESELSEDVRMNFRESLATHLFGWPEISRLRTRLSLADFLWKFSSGARRDECGMAAQEILNSISLRTLRTLIRHLAAIVDVLTADDIAFTMRLVSQSHFPRCPADLRAEAQVLEESTKHLIPLQQSTEPNSIANWYTENCPACQVPIPLIDINIAVCGNGHNWKRCSITTFILSTPWVRTCAGCSRKALLPPSASLAKTGAVHLPPLAKGWVVHELLETVHQCLFCNNTFVSLL